MAKRKRVSKPEELTGEDGLEKEELLAAKGTKSRENKNFSQTKEVPRWTLSEPIGGRMINADPVFSLDEKFLIVADRTTIHVYSTSNSLLTRSIKPKMTYDANQAAQIITYCLSPTDPKLLWVASSDGSIFCIDWTSGTGADQYWIVSSTGCIHMTVDSMESAGRKRDVVFTTEVRKDGAFRITANELASPDSSIKTAARTIYTSNQRIQFLKPANQGSILVGASGNRILLGRLRSTDYDTIDKIRYEFRVFESSETIKSLDIRVSDRKDSSLSKKNILKKTPVVDLVVGDIRGMIFVHSDLAGKLFTLSLDGSLPSGLSIAPRKMHWHRQAVNTVKWSLDGNYIISGGTETVLVLWQLDTGKQQFLPHMSATIQSLVVSPTGTSYAVQLSDNSAMILSTAEMKPTANIAGIQACVIDYQPGLEAEIERVKEASWPSSLIQRTPVAISLLEPSRLLLGVGQTQEVRLWDPLKTSNPFLQTFDLGLGRSLSSQALTRTNITNINVTPSAHRIREPRISFIKISHDGTWLATVDEWDPPERDLQFLGVKESNSANSRRQRREIFLKFWQWNKENGIWELASRIDMPHVLGDASAGRVLDLAADPTSSRFATIGEDRVARIWSTKSRKRDGVIVRGKDGTEVKKWHCQHTIQLAKLELPDSSDNFEGVHELENFEKLPSTACVAFSDDGSLLAAACGGSRHGVLHLADTNSGTVRLSHTHLVINEIYGLEFLAQDLVILSDRLHVFDVVAEDLRFNVKLHERTLQLSTDQKREMIHLAVNPRSQTFAVALPIFCDGVEQNLAPLWTAYSELAIFHQDTPELQLMQTLPTLITALIPSGETYLVLDADAQVSTVIKKGSSSLTTLASSTSALQLDDAADQPVADLMNIVQEEDDEEEAELRQTITPDDTQEDIADDEDDEHLVITQQQLSDIFDGPSFALPPMEELFYQVANLCSSKPTARVGA